MKNTMLTILMMAGVLAIGCRSYGNPAPAPAPTPAPAPAPEPDYDEPAEPMPDSDMEIHDAVHLALERAPNIDASTIEVRVEDGNVYLSGWVRSQTEHDAAHEVAHSVDGVRKVFHEDLEIRS